MAAASADVCARCGRDESNYADQNARLSTSKKCGHFMCQGCLQQTFAMYGSARLGAHRGHTTVRCPAPGCDKSLTAQDFVHKRPEEEEFEREKEIRRKLSRVFNKTLADFGGDAAAYNNYLEVVETYVANLAAGVDVDKTEAAIKAYMSANQSAIAFNSARQDAAAREANEKLANEAAARAEAARRAALEESTRRGTVERLKRQMLDVLLGEQRIGEEQRTELKARLLELQARIRQSQGSGLSQGVTIAGQSASFSAPCPHILPPRLVTPAPSSADGREAATASGLEYAEALADAVRRRYQLGPAAASPCAAGMDGIDQSAAGASCGGGSSTAAASVLEVALETESVRVAMLRRTGGMLLDHAVRWEADEAWSQLQCWARR